MAANSAAISTVKPVSQRRRVPGPGSMRPKNAGLNSDTSDMAVATCPLATSV
jgi:hypothetical protein